MVGGTGTARRPAANLPGPLVARAGLSLLTCLAVAALTPWSRSRLPMAGRLAELALCVLAWEGAILGVRALLRRRAAPVDAPSWLAGAVLVASVPATAGMAVVFRLAGEPVPAPLATYGQALALGLLLAFARRGLARAGLPSPGRDVSAGTEAGPPDGAAAARAFLLRHAPGLAGRRLLALEAEDHYLRFHTEDGSALVLMRLRDAVAALGPDSGWQPHRSFWLAAGIPARAERDGRGWRLALPNGLVVPVSRANVDRMRDAGYLGAARRGGPPGGR